MKILPLITIALALSACSTADNDVIDQAIAARIYQQHVVAGEIRR
jgi:hypothetical protein